MPFISHKYNILRVKLQSTAYRWIAYLRFFICVLCFLSDYIFYSDFRKNVINLNNISLCTFCLCFLLKIYTKCGRRAMPTMMTGSAATFVDCDECWTLLLVTRKGSLYLWDLFNRTCLLQDSLTSLVASSPNSSTKDAGTIYYLHRFDIACTWFSTKLS
jgi:hypothetical protein